MSKVAHSAGGDLIARLEKAEQELGSLREELDSTHKLATLGTLTAGIAHEINNILTPVLAYAQLAQANPKDEALRAKALERAIAGVESASRITEAVLGFARSDGETEHAQVQEVVDSTFACLGHDPTRDGVRVVRDVAPDLWVRIQPLALQQVLLNLVLNALNALHGQPGELRITAAELDDGTTRIRVADTGPGISQEMAARLFTPFVTGHDQGKPTPTGHGGSGLGLAVCRRLIEQSGGTIALEAGSVQSASHATPGATFSITLKTYAAVGPTEGRMIES